VDLQGVGCQGDFHMVVRLIMVGKPNLVDGGVDLGQEPGKRAGGAMLQGSPLGAIGIDGSSDPDAPPLIQVAPLRSIHLFWGQSDIKNGSTRSLCRANLHPPHTLPSPFLQWIIIFYPYPPHLRWVWI
jgi:hypothetical protein